LKYYQREGGKRRCKKSGWRVREGGRPDGFVNRQPRGRFQLTQPPIFLKKEPSRRFAIRRQIELLTPYQVLTVQRREKNTDLENCLVKKKENK